MAQLNPIALCLEEEKKINGPYRGSEHTDVTSRWVITLTRWRTTPKILFNFIGWGGGIPLRTSDWTGETNWDEEFQELLYTKFW